MVLSQSRAAWTSPESPAHVDSYYAATCDAAPAGEPLDGTVDADVCVVGGGFAGVSAALHLARAGRNVLLLEQARIGWGASGRNGGQIHVGMRREQEWLEKRLGREDAAALWALALDARAHLDWLIDHYKIDCDLVPGHFHADHRPRHVRHSRATVELLREHYGHDSIRFVDRDEAREIVATDAYHGGTSDTRGGHLHPLKLALGMARAARQEGARLHEGTRVEAVKRKNGGWLVSTKAGRVRAGQVRAGQVIVAANGYLNGLLPKVEAHVLPINNYVATTVPLDPERADALIRDRVAVSDSRFVIYYFRVTRDHRLLFGGGESYTSRFPVDMAAVVRRHMLRILPQLADTPIAYAWGGTLTVTPNRLPFVRQIEPDLLAISGCCGLGVVLAPYHGRLVADAIVGGSAAFERIAALPVPRFPGGRLLRSPTLAAAMSFYALRDAL